MGESLTKLKAQQVKDSPIKRISPFLARIMPEIVFRRVDLPAPLDPTRATIVSSSTRMDTSQMAWTSPYRTSTPFTSSRCFSKVRLYYFRVIGYFVRFTVGNFYAVIQDNNTVTEIKNSIHLMLDP